MFPYPSYAVNVLGFKCKMLVKLQVSSLTLVIMQVLCHCGMDLGNAVLPGTGYLEVGSHVGLQRRRLP